MANREELSIIRGARAGQAQAQLDLGKRYLSGGAGLPQSLPTALHWLARAAAQQGEEAQLLIGMHIPLELARPHGLALAPCYVKAHAAGEARAALVLAQLVFAPGAQPDAALRVAALGALSQAARQGLPEARALLVRYGPPLAAAPQPAGAARRAAATPVAAPAPLALVDQAWEAGQWQRYLQRALPLALALLNRPLAAPLVRAEVRLLSRCARLIERGVPGHDIDADGLRRLWECAAAEQDRHAQLAMGLWWARMRLDGERLGPDAGSANFKKAIRWLSLAGEQGLAEAWYALSRIYIKPEFSQRNVADAQRYLERAAEMGYREAQLACGSAAWRARRENENNDVRAAYWLQKAAQQGCSDAQQLLRKVAPRVDGPLYRAMGELVLPHGLAARHPLLAARLELAALFRLSRAEALLLDVGAADRGHCLVIDIRASYGRSKRRLVLVQNAAERQALDRALRLFEQAGGQAGSEGNYRQRLYRLKTLVPQAAEMGELELAA